jgi:hypothetical protein
VRTTRALLLDVALEDPIEGLAGHLAGEHGGNLDLTGGPDEGCVDDAEGLGDEGQPCAQERQAVGGVVVDVGQRQRRQRGAVHGGGWTCLLLLAWDEQCATETRGQR